MKSWMATKNSRLPRLCPWFLGRLFGQISVITLILPVAVHGEIPTDRVQAIRDHLDAGRFQEALAAVEPLLASEPEDATLRFLRGLTHEKLRDWTAALTDYDALVTLNPAAPDLRQQRGMTRFRAGDLTGSLQDFDEAIRLEPGLERKHWQRGLTYYLMGDYEQGAKQFSLYQSYYGADVENIAWHMACLARETDWSKAQSKILTLEGDDQRIPLMTVDRLFRGGATPQQVTHAAEATPAETPEGTLSRFYAELYLALYFDARQELEPRDQHLDRAVALRQDHYMWDVANVWKNHLRKK